MEVLSRSITISLRIKVSFSFSVRVLSVLCACLLDVLYEDVHGGLPCNKRTHEDATVGCRVIKEPMRGM